MAAAAAAAAAARQPRGAERGPPYATQVPNTSSASSGPVYRTHKRSLIGETGLRGSTTLHESFASCVLRTPNNPCLGERLLDSSSAAGPFIFKSYGEVGRAVGDFASGLIKQQLLTPNSDGMKILGVYMKNNSSWTIAEYACYSQSAITVPLYDTLGPDTVEFIVNQTEMRTLLCTPVELPVLIALKNAGKCPSLKSVIITAYSKEPAPPSAEACGLQVFTFAQLRLIGSLSPCRPHPPTPSSIATLCYTSGTTGVPKGAIITHRNLVAVANAGLSSCFPDMNSSDLYLSFLPLPHIFERIVISSLLACGAAVGYSRGNPLLIIEDCVALRPTIFCAVPRLLNRIFDKVNQAAVTATGMRGAMLRAALSAKLHNFRQHGQLEHMVWDGLIFGKLKTGLGLDKVRTLISGGAPLPAATMEFFRILIGGKGSVHEGYGQTETAGGTSITYEEDLTVTGHVGGPIPACEIKLVDVPDMGYLHTDTIHNQSQRCDGRGEICVRGPGVFQGYYRDAASTAESFDDNGWLHTGDIGLWTPLGQLAIIDRKKNLLKLSQGEYVAVERVENILTGCPLIAQVFVHGDSTRDSLVAIVVPDEDAVKQADLPIGQEGIEHLHSRIMEQIASASRTGSLHGFETVKAVWVEPPTPASLWTPENGLVTPTFKLKRQALVSKFGKQIESLYSPKSKL